MNLSEIFIKRPIATSLLMLGIALFGVIAYRALPVSDLPNVDFPTLNVGAGLPGGDPGTMASAVASPLERQFTTIAGLDEMTSSSAAGSSGMTSAIAVCTSTAALSIDRARSNCSVTFVLPVPLDEVIESMPAMVVSWRSSGLATADAMVPGSAPGRPAWI